jgi:hypothetical protein
MFLFSVVGINWLTVKAVGGNNLTAEKPVINGNVVTVKLINNVVKNDTVTIRIYDKANNSIKYLNQGKLNNGEITFTIELNPGTYIGYARDITDASSIAIEEFVVEAPDTTAPVITLNGDATVNVANGAVYTDTGVTITDNKDTNLVALVTYSKDGQAVASIDTTVAGTYIVHYNVTDAAGNEAAEVIRTVIVAEPADTTAPVITLNGDATVNVANGAVYTDAGVTITDNKDTNLVALVTYSKDGQAVASIDTSVAGTYIVHYNVTDAAGNKATEVTRTVIVAKPLPDITVEKINTPDSFTLGSEAKIRIKAANNTNSSKDVTLVVALFNGNKMMTYSAARQAVTAKGQVELEVMLSLNYPQPASGSYTTKYFVWESLDSGLAIEGVDPGVIPVTN